MASELFSDGTQHLLKGGNETKHCKAGLGKPSFG